MKYEELFAAFVNNCGLPQRKFEKGSLTNSKTGESITFKDAVEKIGNLLRYVDSKGADIEGLDIMIKASQNGFYRKTRYGIRFYSPNEFRISFTEICTEAGAELYPDEYGEDWAFTKEELE